MPCGGICRSSTVPHAAALPLICGVVPAACHPKVALPVSCGTGHFHFNSMFSHIILILVICDVVRVVLLIGHVLFVVIRFAWF